MEDLKKIIAKNITDLRTAKGITQLELAEKLNYSDKAVSKWERGESIPDVTVLKQIADIFDVTLDYFVHSGNDRKKAIMLHRKGMVRNHGFITGMCILLVWLVAAIVYMFAVSLSTINVFWLSFVYAIPLSFVIWLIFNAIWFSYKRNFLIISLLLWSVLASVYVSFLAFGINLWLVFILGVPSQIIIILWSNLKFKH